MDVNHKENKQNGVFYMEDHHHQIASMNYVLRGTDTMVIHHTEVSQDYEGKGLGKELVNAGVAFARKMNIKILPLCTFAKAILTKSEEYADVIVNE